MTTPTPGRDDAGALDRLHAQARRRAANLPEFDVQDTLDHIFSRWRADSPPFPLARAISRSLRVPIGHRVLRVRVDIGRRTASPATAPRRLPERSPATFWAALSPAERNEFAALADQRTFAAGARLMREGEAANHVLVILQGRTRISVLDIGGERVVAERGPGDLIGERAALQVSVRSATVVAMETVRALAMKTEDFAAYLSSHPDVLGIVERQVYARLTEGPPGSGRRGFHRRQELTAGEHSPWSWQFPNGENCTVILADAVGAGRTGRDRGDIRRTITDITGEALHTIWDACLREDRGDGLLVVVPPAIPAADVLDRLSGMLPAALKRHNRGSPAAGQIQLRVALDAGPVVNDTDGVSGDAVARTARLLEAPALKRAISEKDASLGVIVSMFIRKTAAERGGGVVAAPDYEEIQAEVKQPSLATCIQLLA